jgi:N-acetylglucosaminyldiphosphoundecaprenol N-acetyl-beta-D-mannosaminyltransferase
MRRSQVEDWFDSVVEQQADGTCAFVNPSAWKIARDDPGYAKNLAQFDLVLPDGGGVVLGARLLNIDIPERISFDATSLAVPVFQRCAERGLKVALIGGRPGIAQRAAGVLQGAFPKLQIPVVQDGYFGELTEVVSRLKAEQIDVVVCGMGVPAQERTMLALRDGGWVGVAFSCGGFLDQLVSGLKYYPGWVDSLNLRFVYRLFREPRRLWRRYAVGYQPFVKTVLAAAFARNYRKTVDGRRSGTG